MADPQPQMNRVYDLRRDHRRIADVQHATQHTDRYGIVPEHGLFGSDEWWQAVHTGALETHTIEGRISRVYMSGHGDFPEFEVDDGSSRTQWERFGDDAWFVVGRRVRVAYVFTKSRYSGELHRTVLGIWIGDDAA
jgi:hypothetical protein